MNDQIFSSHFNFWTMLVASAIFVVLSLTSVHLLLLYSGRRLPRVPAFVAGTLCWVIPPTIYLAWLRMWPIIIFAGSSLVIAGITTVLLFHAGETRSFPGAPLDDIPDA